MGASVTQAKDRQILAAAADLLLREAGRDPRFASKQARLAKIKTRRRRAQKAVDREAERECAAVARAEARQGVYVIGAPGHPVKIGIAKCANSRLQTLQTGCPEKLKVYLFLDVPAGMALAAEKACHDRLADQRLSGEWFSVDWRDACAAVREVVEGSAP